MKQLVSRLKRRCRKLLAKRWERFRKLEDLPLEQLRLRAAVTGRVAREAHAKGDERWHEAARQQRRLNDAIAAKIREERLASGTPEPPTTMIQMKMAVQRSRAFSPGQRTA